MSKQSTAVKKQAEEADRLHKEIYGEGAGDDDSGEQGAQLSEVPPAEGSGEPPAGAAEESVPPTAEEPPGDTPPAESEPAPEPPVAEETWEAKYKTLQGIFNTEVPRLQGKLKQRDAKVKQLEATIEGMQAAPAPEPAPGPNGTTLITQEEIDDYGPEMTDFIKRAAKEMMAPELERLSKENEQLRNQNLQLSNSGSNVEPEVEADSRTALLTQLAQAVPEWQVLNVQPEFLTWLAQADAFSGQPRQHLLNEAYEADDAPRVIAIFQTFVREQALVSPQEDAPFVQTETPPVSLDSLVAPGKAPTTTTQQPPLDGSDQEIWSTAEIQAFYRDVQRGKFRGREAEKDRIEQRIVKAGNEGRVR